MKTRIVLLALALTASILAVAALGFAWYQTNDKRAEYVHYARLVDFCRLQPVSDLRLACFDSTITGQP